MGKTAPQQVYKWAKQPHNRCTNGQNSLTTGAEKGKTVMTRNVYKKMKNLSLKVITAACEGGAYAVS
jgi:hypothetical protein